MPTRVQSVHGRGRATLVRGVDRYGYWDEDALPRADLDPQSMAQLAATWGKYKDGETRQAADMAAERRS